MRIRLLSVVLGLAVVFALMVVSTPVAAIHWCSPSTLSATPSQGYAGDTDQFAFTLTDNIADALNVQSFTVTYSWVPNAVNLGSGSMAGYASYSWTDSEALPTAGSYTISIAVSGKAVGDLIYETCTYGPYSFTSQALPPPPTVIATANPSTGTAPLTVSFYATVSQGLGPFTYSWSFGDGTAGVGQSVSHTYSSIGTFTAQVVVTDSRSRSASNSATITVSSSGGGGGGGPNTGPATTPPMDFALWIALLIIVVVVVVAAVLVAGRRRKNPPIPPQAPGRASMPPP